MKSRPEGFERGNSLIRWRRVCPSADRPHTGVAASSSRQNGAKRRVYVALRQRETAATRFTLDRRRDRTLACQVYFLDKRFRVLRGFRVFDGASFLLDLIQQFGGCIVLGFWPPRLVLWAAVVSCAALSRQLTSSPNMLMWMVSLFSALFWWLRRTKSGRLSFFTVSVSSTKACLDPSSMDTSSVQACARTRCGAR